MFHSEIRSSRDRSSDDNDQNQFLLLIPGGFGGGAVLFAFTASTVRFVSVITALAVWEKSEADTRILIKPT